MATDFEIGETSLPMDVTPDFSSESVTGDYDPEFPGSTPEAPYGFKPDGSPYLRRPKGKGKSGGSSAAKTGTLRRTPASEQQAATAAALLARMNLLIGLSLNAMGLPGTSAALVEANDQFENMAREALLTDPALCRKILSAGATSGKTALIMAYGMLGVSVVPSALGEIKARRAEEIDPND